MTEPGMTDRVLAQLRSFPHLQARTAGDIAAGMAGKLAAKDIGPALAALGRSGLAVCEEQPQGPDKWRLA